jgi:hypothetical protein
MHDDLFIRPDKGRNHDPHAIVEDGGLEALGGSLPIENRLCLDNPAGHFLGQSNRERFLPVELHRGRHPVLQEGAPLAQQLCINLDLLETVGVHEHQTPVSLVEELLIPVLEPNLFDLILRTEPFIELAAIADVFHLGLSKRAALAGFDVVDLHDGPEAPIVIENRAGANFVPVDLRHVTKPWQKVEEM